MNALWHPQATMAAVEGRELVVARGHGAQVWDEAGRRYIDATAGLWYANVGYGRSAIAEAVATQLRKLHTYPIHHDLATRPALDLAERVSELGPQPGSKVLFTSGGSEAIDTAAKLARRYFVAIGQAQRTVFIVRTYAYHGLNAFGTSLTGIPENKEGHGPLIEDVEVVRWDSIDDLHVVIERVGAQRIAAFVYEPVIGTGGVRIPPPHYLPAAEMAVRQAGGLLIADEVVTAFGRLGAWFGTARLGLQPDLVTFAKGITSGYAPLGGVLVAPHVAAPFWRPGVRWRHGYTYAGHAAAAVAALTNLAILEKEDLLARALVLEERLGETLRFLEAHPLVSEVRAGLGVMAAVQLQPDAPQLAARAVKACRDRGVLTRVLEGGALQISPPLVVQHSELERMADAVANALEDVASGR